VWADLRFNDLTLDPSERKPGCYAGDARRANLSPFGLGKVNTCRSWLSMWSMDDSDCRAERHLQRIPEPSLLVQSLGDAGIFPSDAHATFEAMGAPDKQLTLISGDHYFQHEGSRDECADVVDAWLRERT